MVLRWVALCCGTRVLGLSVLGAYACRPVRTSPFCMALKRGHQVQCLAEALYAGTPMLCLCECTQEAGFPQISHARVCLAFEGMPSLDEAFKAIEGGQYAAEEPT